MIRTSLAALVLVAAMPAFAQERGVVRQACQADFAAHCPGIEPGGGRLAACIKEKRASFSDGCKVAMQTARAQRKAN